jgi:hypothetical protein
MRGLARRSLIALYQAAHLAVIPGHWAALWRDLRPGQARIYPDRVHLQAALNWLCRAQDACPEGGVSAGYFLTRGWAPSYPETTGYIIPTLLRGAALLGRPELIERAVRLGDWEREIQLPDGAVRGGRSRLDAAPYPIVFNTGQVICGWVSLHRVLGEPRFLDAARQAADWLVQVQDADGQWRRHVHGNAATVYHSRVAWALFEVGVATDDRRYRLAAAANIRWTLGQLDADGWSARMALEPGDPPLTHTIAYTLRGLLESLPFLDAEIADRARTAVTTAALALADRVRPTGGRPASLPAFLGPKWIPQAGYSCLTGEAQLVGVWTRLCRLTGDDRFGRAARLLLLGVKAAQALGSRHPGIHGGLAGSRPLWGGYVPLAYPNWAAKFLVDALLEQSASELAGLPSLPG